MEPELLFGSLATLVLVTIIIYVLTTHQRDDAPKDGRMRQNGDDNAYRS
jgi:hypothetical protein